MPDIAHRLRMEPASEDMELEAATEIDKLRSVIDRLQIQSRNDAHIISEQTSELRALRAAAKEFQSERDELRKSLELLQAKHDREVPLLVSMKKNIVDLLKEVYHETAISIPPELSARVEAALGAP